MRTPTVGQVTDEPGAWRTYGEKTLYDNRWVRLGLVDVQAPNGERWDYHVVHFGLWGFRTWLHALTWAFMRLVHIR